MDIRCYYYGGKKAEFVTDRAVQWIDTNREATTVVYHLLAGIIWQTQKNVVEFDEAEQRVAGEVYRLIEICKGRNIKVLVCSVPPLPGVEEEAREINAALVSLVSEEDDATKIKQDKTDFRRLWTK